MPQDLIPSSFKGMVLYGSARFALSSHRGGEKSDDGAKGLGEKFQSGVSESNMIKGGQL